MSNKKLIFWQFIIIFVPRLRPSTQAGKSSINVVLTQMQGVIHDHNIVSLMDFHFHSYRGRNLINGSFSYYQVIRKLNMQIMIDFEKPDKTRLHMIELATDACDLTAGKLSKNKFAQLVVREFAKQKQFPYQCPIEANKTYALVNFALQLPQFPFPNVKFIASVIFYDEKKEHKISEIRIRGATKRMA